MMAFLFASILLLAGLVLVSTIHFLKSKHLHDAHSKSLSKMQSNSSLSGNSSCQTCHLCGGLRLRTQNAASVDYFAVSKSHSGHRDEAAGGQSRPIRHQWLALRTQILLSIKHAVQKLISHHKRQAHGDFFINQQRLSNLFKRKMNRHSTDICAVPAGLPASEGKSDLSIGSSLATSIDGTVSNAVDVADTNEFDKLVALETQNSTEIASHDSPVHRVVLEILVSPSVNSKESSCAISPGITLKLETSATHGRLAGCTEALKNMHMKNCEDASDSGQVLLRENDSLPTTLGSSCAHGDQTSQRLNQILKDVILLPKDEIKSSDFVPAKSEIADKDSILNSFSSNKSCRALTDLRDCPKCCHVLGDIIEQESSKGPTVKSSAPCGQLKLRSSKCLCGSALSDVAVQHMVEYKEGSGMATGVPLNNLGSLHISFLKSNEREEIADVNSKAGSMLASLDVADKLTAGISSGSENKEKSNNKGRVISDTGSSRNSAFTRAPEAEGVYEESLMKKEDHCSLQGSTNKSPMYDFTSPSKKSKKKKKAKGKKPKANMDSLVVDAREKQEIGKVALEAAKLVYAVPERELGCVCGAMKGSLHNDSCPYPFISPGSMLQRKMREQYNDLVRSNAAKTLTLAQVGQFTSCLVEAKATLQQKSDSIQRKYTITKSLLSKADKSSFDRLCSQIYGLEMEQKKLEEDTIVYNRLQEQLKLSPAYQKMLEYGRAHFELQPHTGQMMEKMEPEDSEMSFEDFLEQEKKDVFWQRHNLARSALSAS